MLIKHLANLELINGGVSTVAAIVATWADFWVQG